MMLRLASILVIACLITACGFHLRGFGSLPEGLQRLYVDDSGLSENQRRLLYTGLQRAGAQILSQGGDQLASLRVKFDTADERKLVDSAGSGQHIVRLSRRLRFSVLSVQGEKLIDNKVLIQSIDLELDENNLLGTEGEREQALADLDSSLINRMMLQLQRL